MSEHHRRACELLTYPSIIFDGKNTWTMGSPSILYSYHRITGELEQEVETLKDSMPFFCRVTNNLGYGADLVMEAEHYYMGESENADIAAHKAYLETQEDWYSGVSLCAVFLKARIAMQKGDFKSVLSFFKFMREKVDEKKVHVFHLHTLDICEAFLYSGLNACEHIQPWLLDGNFKGIKFSPSMGFVYMVYGRIMLIRKEYLELIGSTEHFMEIASIFQNLLAKIYIYIYLAAANERILRRNHALDALKKALELSMPDKLYMPFVENGDFIKPLLEELFRQGCFCEDITRMLSLYTPYQIATTRIMEEFIKKAKPVLTEREDQIARLASEGFSNRQIGEKLFVSENTVKTQLKSLSSTPALC